MTKTAMILSIAIALTSACPKSRVTGDRTRDENIGADPLTYTIAQQEGQTAAADLYAKAKDLLDKNDSDNARKLYEAVVSSEPTNATGYVGLAACAMHDHDLELARQYYDKAGALDTKSIGPKLGLGSVAYLQGRFRDAAIAYEGAINQEPSNADAHWGAAVAYDALRERAKSREHAEHFLALAPQSALAPRARELSTGEAP
jgi:Tfp pilus assembly protein PilF